MPITIRECHSAQEVRDLYLEVHRRMHARTAPPPRPPATRAEALSLTVRHMGTIQRIVAAFYGVPVGLMSARYKGTRIIRPRFVAVYLCRKLTDATTTQIGQAFGGRDHATILSALRRVDKEMQRSHDFVVTVARVHARVTSHFAMNGNAAP